jgi:S-adenosylmethionine:tRNA ribosyltransferase-isomerase
MKSNMPNIFIQDFDYALPEAKIALFPLENRDDSKLLVHRLGQTSHHFFKDLPGFLPENGLLIFNNTKVIPARIALETGTGSKIEVFLLRPIQGEIATQSLMNAKSESIWECLIGNKKKWKTDQVIIQTIIIHGHKVNLRFHWFNRHGNLVKITWDVPISLTQILEAVGQIPLPPYLDREVEIADKNRYQTIFSKEAGAVAAPTASLHFSEKVFKDIEKRGIKQSFLTLHVGAGTFLPVKEENVQNHPMHREQLIFSKEFIENLHAHDGPHIPVGTTSLRALESLYWAGVWLNEGLEIPSIGFTIPKEFPYLEREKIIDPKESLSAVLAYMHQKGINEWILSTELLIMPGYDLKFCDAIVTNFHQPKSTLLVLVSAIIGDCWKQIYEKALQNDYRFLSYGDACLFFK